MKLLDKAQIIARLDPELATQRLEEGFIAFSNGQVQAPPTQAFQFSANNGDCCIKSAFVEGSDTFTVKVSTGFYDNPGKGLPSNDGLMLVCCAHTGRPLALLQDEGWLTAVRTALAGRIVARLLAPSQVTAIGILGTGLQARLQLQHLMPVTACRRVIVWGRGEQQLAAFQEHANALGFQVTLTHDPQHVAEGANLIVSATPSRQPLLRREWLRPGTHITAVGADAPGKQELDPALVASADRLIVDSIRQCSHYGEVAHAVRAGLIDEQRLGELGHLLQGHIPGRSDEREVTLADLTGVAVQDAQIARCVLQATPA